MFVLIAAGVAKGVALVLSVLVLVLTRRARPSVRDPLRLLWAALTVVGAAYAIVLMRKVRPAGDEVNPLEPGVVNICAILQIIEAFFLTSFSWMPRVFDWFERVGGAMLIAVRQLRARKSGFLTVISFLAFLGVGLSSCGLCFTTSIMSGFGNDLKHKILGNNAHVVIDRERGGFGDWQPLLAEVRRVPGVASATPLVQGEVMVTSQTDRAGVVLRGIDPGTGAAGALRRELIRGRLEYLTEPERLLALGAADRRPVVAREPDDGVNGPRLAVSEPPDAPGAPRDLAPLPRGPVAGDVLSGVVIGREIATNLHLAVGDEVRVISPFGGMVTPVGVLPKTRLFRVAGIFYSGMYEYDAKYAYLTIPVAQNFFNFEHDQISSIEVRVADVDAADAVAAQLGPLAARRGLRVRDWKQVNQNLFRALKLEKLMMFVLLGVAIVVASFAIVATLLLLVKEKGREIAVLKAMGASEPFVARVFVFVGLLIGVVGSALGTATALIVCVLIQKLGVPLDPEVYYIDRLPVFISLSDYAFVVIISVLVCLVATLYPAVAASRLRPVEGMRFG